MAGSSIWENLPESIAILLYEIIYWQFSGLLWIGVPVALIATAVTLYLVEKKNLSAPVPKTLYLRKPGKAELLPALCAALLGGFWMTFASTALPLEFYAKQDTIYKILLWVTVLLCVALALRNRGRGLLPALMLGIGGLTLPDFGTLMVYIADNGIYERSFKVASKVYQHRAQSQPDQYMLYTAGSTETILAAAAVVILCVALAFVGLRTKTKTEPLTKNETGA